MKRSYKRVLFVGLIAGCLAFSTGCSKVELDYHNGLAVYEKHGKMGAVDEKKKTVIPFEYDLLGTFDEDVTWMEKSGKYGLVDKNGMVVVAPQYDSIGSLDEDIVRVEKNGLFGFIDKKGNVVVDLTYEVADDVFYDGLARVAIADGNYRKFGFINTKGEIVIKPTWGVARHFGDGLAPVAVKGLGLDDSRWGYIGTTGKMVIPYQYVYALEFSEGLAAVTIDKKGEEWGYINTEGNVVIRNEESAWRDVTSFREGCAWVNEFVDTYPIDKSGKAITNNWRTTDVSDFINGYARVEGSYPLYADRYVDIKGNVQEEAPDSVIRKDSIWAGREVYDTEDECLSNAYAAYLKGFSPATSFGSSSPSSSSSSTSSSTSSSSSTKKNTCGYCGRSFDITSADGKSITRRHLCTKCYSVYNALKDYR